MAVGSVFGLNYDVCSANSNSISLGAQEPWGLKWTLVSLCCYSIAPCLLAWPHTPLLSSSIIHKHVHDSSVPGKHSEPHSEPHRHSKVHKTWQRLENTDSLWADRPGSLCGSHTPGRQTCGSVCHCRSCTQLDMGSRCSWNSHDDTRWWDEQPDVSRNDTLIPAHSGDLGGWRTHTICNMAFPRFLQASIPGPARHKGSFLGSSSDLGAAPALADKPHLKEEVRNDKTLQLIPYCRKSISKSCE